MTIVKFCGITSLHDALASLEAGVDLIGFNFYPPSPRCISPAECARLVEELRKRGATVLLAGVFVNAAPEEMLRIADQCHLDLIQLSGDEPAAVLPALKGRAVKAIRPRSLESAFAEARAYARPGKPPALLLDAWKPGEFGGTGVTGNWEIAHRLSAAYPILLAGGLHPGNVAQAIEQARPWGVDVASGIESTPGRKDPRKMKAFIQAVRSVAISPSRIPDEQSLSDFSLETDR